MTIHLAGLALALLPGCLMAQSALPQRSVSSSPVFYASAASRYTPKGTFAPVKNTFRLTSRPVSPKTDGAAFRIGLRGGGNYVLPLESVEGATYQNTFGYHGGLVFNIGRGMITFQPEVNYSQISVKAGASIQGFNLSVQGINNRVEVPLLVKASFGDPDRARFFVNAGPYAAYILSSRLKASLGPFGDIDEKVTFEGSEGRISYGLAGGLGVAIPLGPGHLTIEGRGLYELGDNAKNMTVDPTIPVDTDVQNTKYLTLQASIGYLIPIGGR
ncbi:porin family protein [Rudanella lutea]|uniref:porin family protein n=1 Tax=Rudanella lutea TaxID=451374 RepID=UPI00036A34A6|nr:porin family protein [Rudanella lutea]